MLQSHNHNNVSPHIPWCMQLHIYLVGQIEKIPNSRINVSFENVILLWLYHLIVVGFAEPYKIAAINCHPDNRLFYGEMRSEQQQSHHRNNFGQSNRCKITFKNCHRWNCVGRRLQWMIWSDHSESIWFLVIKIETFRFPCFYALSLSCRPSPFRVHPFMFLSYAIWDKLMWENARHVVSTTFNTRSNAERILLYNSKQLSIEETGVDRKHVLVWPSHVSDFVLRHFHIYLCLLRLPFANTGVAYHFVSIIIKTSNNRSRVKEKEKRIMFDVSKRCRQRIMTKLYSEMQCVVRPWILLGMHHHENSRIY